MARTRPGGKLKISGNPGITLLPVLLSGIVVFIIDIFLAHGYFAFPLYILPLLLSFFMPMRGAAYPVMAGITLAVIAAVFFKPAPLLPAVIPVYLIVFNRGLAVLFGWGLAWILERHKSALRELVTREKEFRLIIDSGPTLISYIDTDSRYIRVNKVYERWFGKSADQVQGRHVREVMGEAAWEIVLPYLDRVLSGEAVTYEKKLKVGRGEPRWVRATYTPDRDGSGRVRGFVVHAADIEERKRAEESLAGEKAFSDALINGLPGVFYLFNEDGRFWRWNRNLEEVSGYSSREISAMSPMDFFNPREKETIAATVRRVFSEGQANVEASLSTKDGKEIPYYFIGVRIYIENTPYLIGEGIDLTEQKKAEEALRLSEARFRAIFEQSPLSTQILSTDGRTLQVNRAWEKLWGATIRDLKNYNILEDKQLEAKDLMPYIRKGFSGEPSEVPIAVYNPAEVGFADRPRSVKGYIYPVKDAAGRTLQIVLTHIDVTDLKDIEQRLSDAVKEATRTAYEIRTLVENSPDMIVRFDHSMRYVYANPAYERITGMAKERLTGRTNAELGMPEELETAFAGALRQVVTAKKETTVEFGVQSLFGKRHFLGKLTPEFEASGMIGTVLLVARDITEIKQAEEHIRFISFHDTVTGLYNRSYFEEEIRRIDTVRELPISVIMGDVNNLKVANDIFGHEEGDRMLRKIGEIIRKCCRNEDVVARWGGDEFVAILPRTALAVAEEISRRIKEGCGAVQETILAPSIGLGASAKLDIKDNVYRVLREAEEKMYKEKAGESRCNQETVIRTITVKLKEKYADFEDNVRYIRAIIMHAGRSLGLQEKERADLIAAAFIHELGKVIIPEAILMKRGPLSPDERETMKRHSETGFKIARSYDTYAHLAGIVLSLHERWDGNGYPQKLKGRRIPHLARVLAIFFAYDSMTRGRPYRSALTSHEAFEELRRNAGTQFDGELVESFIDAMRTKTAVIP